MEVSNVAFFPAYPAIAAVLRYGSTSMRHRAARHRAGRGLGFLELFLSLLRTLEHFAGAPIFRRACDLAHPAAFFLIAGYSESLFMMGLLGFMYWSSAEGRAAKILAALHGFVMSATRIVGIPCAAFPVVRAVFKNGWRGLRERGVASAIRPGHRLDGRGDARCGRLFHLLPSCAGVAGICICSRRQAGWAIEPDYFAVFKPASYRWLVPALNNPTEASQMAMTLGGVASASVAALRTAAGDSPPRGLADAGRHLFLRGRHLLHLGQRRGLGGDGEHAALRILRACVNRAGAFAFFASISHSADCSCGHSAWRPVALAQCGRAQRAGLVRLEFYAGKLGCIRIMKTNVAIIGAGPAGLTAALSPFQERSRRHRPRGRSGLRRRHFPHRDLQRLSLRHRRPSFLFQIEGGRGFLDRDFA